MEIKQKPRNFGIKDFSQCSEYSFWLSGLAAVIINCGGFEVNLFVFSCSKVLNACEHALEIRRNACCVVCCDSRVTCAPVHTLAQMVTCYRG